LETRLPSPQPSPASGRGSSGLPPSPLWGEGRGEGQRGTLFPYSSPESIWLEHRESTRGRDLDITGLSYALLDRDGPQQWPYPEGATAGQGRLYTDGNFATPSGRARFFAENYRPVAEPVDARYPLRLTTGRLRDQWHGMSRTGRASTLFGHAPEPRLAMNAADMARRGIGSGELVRVESRRGALHVVVEADESVRSGQAWLPMHWGKRFLGGRASAGVNTLTSPAVDPHSRQPELKHAAVRVAPAALAWRAVAFAEMDEAAIGDALASLHGMQDAIAFLSVVPAGRERPGILVRAANDGAPDAQWTAALDRLLGLDAPGLLRYDDPRRGHARRIRLAEGRLAAARISGAADVVANGEWLHDCRLGGEPIEAVRRFLLSPSGRPNPTASPLRPRLICNCFGMAEDEIAAALARGETPACGTNCGSCLPEVRAIAARVRANAGTMAA
jgi:assimilatory nitrate reductase catalytic subunit